MKQFHYMTGGKRVKKAYFKFRTNAPYFKHSATSFVAGWNAALCELSKIVGNKSKIS